MTDKQLPVSHERFPSTMDVGTDRVFDFAISYDEYMAGVSPIDTLPPVGPNASQIQLFREAAGRYSKLERLAVAEEFARTRFVDGYIHNEYSKQILLDYWDDDRKDFNEAPEPVRIYGSFLIGHTVEYIVRDIADTQGVAFQSITEPSTERETVDDYVEAVYNNMVTLLKDPDNADIYSTTTENFNNTVADLIGRLPGGYRLYYVAEHPQIVLVHSDPESQKDTYLWAGQRDEQFGKVIWDNYENFVVTRSVDIYDGDAEQQAMLEAQPITPAEMQVMKLAIGRLHNVVFRMGEFERTVD